jgi:hypothetical protein
MKNEINLLKNNDNKIQSDVEWIRDFYYDLKEKGLSSKKAFSVIYFLQEHLPVFPDNIEQCSNCGELYDTYSQGHHSEMTGKFYCSESCEPAGLYEKEERWEKRKDALFQRFLKSVKGEQKHYPFLKDKEISESVLRGYFTVGKTPIETLNEIITVN